MSRSLVSSGRGLRCALAQQRCCGQAGDLFAPRSSPNAFELPRFLVPSLSTQPTRTSVRRQSTVRIDPSFFELDSQRRRGPSGASPSPAAATSQHHHHHPALLERGSTALPSGPIRLQLPTGELSAPQRAGDAFGSLAADERLVLVQPALPGMRAQLGEPAVPPTEPVYKVAKAAGAAGAATTGESGVATAARVLQGLRAKDAPRAATPPPNAMGQLQDRLAAAAGARRLSQQGPPPRLGRVTEQPWTKWTAPAPTPDRPPKTTTKARAKTATSNKHLDDLDPSDPFATLAQASAAQSNPKPIEGEVSWVLDSDPTAAELEKRKTASRARASPSPPPRKLTAFQARVEAIKARNAQSEGDSSSSRATSSSGGGAAPEKRIELNWAIDSGDMDRQLRNLRKWLARGMKVTLAFKPKRRDQRRLDDAEAEALLARVREAAKSALEDAKTEEDGGAKTQPPGKMVVREHAAPQTQKLGGSYVLTFEGPAALRKGKTKGKEK